MEERLVARRGGYQKFCVNGRINRTLEVQKDCGVMPISREVLDELLKEYKNPEDLLGDQGILQQLTKALVERALEGELTHQLGYEKHSPEGHNTGNSRNGTTPKTVRGKRGEMRINVQRDRNSEFGPQLVKKGQTRFNGFDDKIPSLYARGMTTREIQGHLEEIYGVDVSPDLISTVTDAVLGEVKAWQTRALDEVYPIVYLDALQVKVRDQGRVSNRAIYLAIGVNMSGLKEVLGMWSTHAAGARIRQQCINPGGRLSAQPNEGQGLRKSANGSDKGGFAAYLLSLRKKRPTLELNLSSQGSPLRG